MRIFFSIVIFLFSVPVLCVANDVDSLFAELDEQILQRAAYCSTREQRIASLMDLKAGDSSSAERNFTLNKQLIDEYITFQVDSAIVYFQQNLALARVMRDKEQWCRTSIDLAHFYATTGFYYEASQMLEAVDTTALTPALELNYYIAQHKLNDELLLYSNDVSQSRRSAQLATYYNERIAQTAEPESYIAHQTKLWQAMQDRDYERAALISEQMMSLSPELSREWATASFMRGLTARLMGHETAFMEWMLRSAIVDMRLGIRDYAALKIIAEYCTNYDIERSMRYMRVMMEDVQAFNSRLRPWQDAMIWPEIEKGYHDYTKRVAATQMRYIYLLGALSLVVIILLLYVVRQNRRLRDARQNMHQSNEQLNASVENLKQVAERLTELNSQVVEANSVKEEYIGIFLQVCSEYIDKMVNERRRILKSLRAGKAEELRKELDGTRLENEELKQLYNLFDSTFLRLYPTFVEELNALLAEDSRIELKKGEYLNTQLRIFALIRLGINDTPRIATLLHYSLSTIYNYRSRIRYNTGITRDEFEQRIRTIGSFSR